MYVSMLLQRQTQPCAMSNTGACQPVNPVIHPITVSRAMHAVTASRACSSTATYVTGRSPSLLAMERVMPKYASWASPLDVNVARWRRVRDRYTVANQFSAPDALMPTGGNAGASQCMNALDLPVSPSPAAAAGGGGGSCGGVAGDRLGSLSNARMMPSTSISCATVSMSDSSYVHSVKDELRVHLSHLSASNSASCNIGQVGKAAFMIYTLTALPFYLIELQHMHTYDLVTLYDDILILFYSFSSNCARMGPGHLLFPVFPLVDSLSHPLLFFTFPFSHWL